MSLKKTFSYDLGRKSLYDVILLILDADYLFID